MDEITSAKCTETTEKWQSSVHSAGGFLRRIMYRTGHKCPKTRPFGKMGMPCRVSVNLNGDRDLGKYLIYIIYIYGECKVTGVTKIRSSED